jgi:hypothetical protein
MVKACAEESASGNTKDVAGELREAEGAQTAGGVAVRRSGGEHDHVHRKYGLRRVRRCAPARSRFDACVG